MSNKMAFLDVNGCVIENNCNRKNGNYYITLPEHCVFLEGVGLAHKLLLESDFVITWVTCQDSIKEGLISERMIVGMFEGMAKIVGAYCENEKAITECRIIVNEFVGLDSDPKIQAMKARNKANHILELVDKYNAILADSIAIGDRQSDISAYQQAGIGYKYQILTPYGDDKSLGADGYYHSLLECVKDFVLPF